MDNLALQESWAQPFIPTYQIILWHGKVSLDAYLHGLFVAYHDCFHCLLGVPENPTDISSVRAWKHRALTSLAHLMLRVHNNHSITMTSSLAPTMAPSIPSPESRTRRCDIPIPSVPELQPSTEELVKISEEIKPQDDLSLEAAPKATNKDNVFQLTMTSRQSLAKEIQVPEMGHVLSEYPSLTLNIGSKWHRSTSVDDSDRVESSSKRFCPAGNYTSPPTAKSSSDI
ncbi:hypothetical protein EV421DRAFT_1739756 [Armillaria borealis]|uniref:Uncharacterized protein n=1 Tax=Armillaria borealis TaxID=47425 RepID=A0AA39J670_9AGAR|nr:hypothetical protein EV421DRAFT_1739756 [Armillaria borealis]